MKDLELYLIDNERNMSWLARHCNVSPAAVKGWLDQKHFPSKNIEMLYIELLEYNYEGLD